MVKDYQQKKIELENRLNQFRSEITLLLKNTKIVLITFVLSIIRLTLLFSASYFALRCFSIDFDLSMMDSICITVFIYMIAAFIPIPGGSGSNESFYVIFYTSFVGKTLASSSMLLWRFSTYYFILIIGAITFGLLNKNDRKRE